MIKIYLIRHSLTDGNTKGRYIGVTNEPLCNEGRELLKNKTFLKPQRLVVSPLKRCIETAEIIFPKVTMRINEELRECDFGDFENKNYIELQGNEDYQKWIDSNGTLPFPNGEDHESFKKRCIHGFVKEVDEAIADGIGHLAFVVHGGTVMSVLQYLTKDEDFYKYQIKNGDCICVSIDEEKWQAGDFAPRAITKYMQ